MTKYHSVILLALATGWLAGCEGSDDPASGQLGDGVIGLVTGAYEARLNERRGSLDTLEAEKQELQRQLEESRREQARVARQRSQVEQELGGLGDELDLLAEQLTAAEQSRAADHDVLAAIRQELRALEQQHDAMAGGQSVALEEKAARLAELQRQSEVLQSALLEALGPD